MTDLRYFGTDGIRGEALQGPLSLEHTTRWGRAWGQVARQRGIDHLLVGWDPRLSSEPLVKAFLAGLDGLLSVELLGIVPTPAVAWLTARKPRTWGLMVSASHNPPADNGLKGFSNSGEKLEAEDEAAIEAAFEGAAPATPLTELPPILQGPMEDYLAHLGTLPQKPLRLVIDCAHGATAPWAPRLFSRHEVTWLGCPADGARINVGVGSTHLEALQAKVRELNADLGIAFDGDGDRILLVDPAGEVVDGDQQVWLLARERHREAPIPGVVGTIMSNGGLESALQRAGIPFLRTPVGDKFMSRALTEHGWDLAAEASGHIIQRHLGPSGDGMGTALSVLRRLGRMEDADRWNWRFEAWPQELVNLTAPQRRPLQDCRSLTEVQSDLMRTHGDSLRLVIRWSGTEPKLRLMGEAREAGLLRQAMARLETAARADLFA